MATVRPLRAVRYHPSLRNHIGHLLAPPYDTVASIDAVGSRSTYNIAHLENVHLGGPAEPHQLAAERYRAWREADILIRDPSPRLYLHEHQFRENGFRYTRRGLLARVRLHAWDERVILPHERTFDGPRQERLDRLRAVQANLSPLYLLYRDSGGDLQAFLDASVAGQTPLLRDEMASGGAHHLFALPDETVHKTVERFFADRRLYVADGHHRYEAALAYRAERRDAASSPNPDAPSEFVLALLASVDDPGVRVLPTHRLVSAHPALDPAWLRERLARLFDLTPMNPDWSIGIRDPGFPAELSVCGLQFPDDPRLWSVQAKPDRPHESLMPAAIGWSWRSFDAAIVDEIILRCLLEIPAADFPERVSYLHDAAAARAAVKEGYASLALLLAPPSLETLTRIADEGDRLPPKSTYFEPKAAAGLVINDLSP